MIYRFLFLFLFPVSVMASIETGLGTTSFTSGRLVPALAIAYKSSDWILSGVFTGVRNAYYYQSSYSLMYFRTWNVGTMWGGEMQAGIGGGGAYSQRSLLPEGVDQSEQIIRDNLIGPGFRMNWSFADTIYFNMEALYGLNNPWRSLSSLNFQDVVCFSVGMRF